MAHPGGRPPHYKTVEQMQPVIDEYFENCQHEYFTDDDGKPIYNPRGEPVIKRYNFPSVTGLALALGFSSRTEVWNYQKKKEFSNAITRAKMKIDAAIESEMRSDKLKPQAGIFLLKNMKTGWEDKQTLEHTGGDKPVETKIVYEVTGVKPANPDKTD